MPDKTIKSALDKQKSIEKQKDSIDKAGLRRCFAGISPYKSLLENSSIQKMLAEAERHQAMMRMVAGPLSEMKHAAMLSSLSSYSREIEMASRAATYNAARFYLPGMVDTTRLIEKFHISINETLARYTEVRSTIQSIQNVISGMRTPWLDAQDELRSIKGLAALQGIGHALQEMPAFGHNLGAALRVDLGDWRDTISWPSEIFTDYNARADFYVSHGFNPALTDFPASAFEESLDIAHLGCELPDLVELYGSPVPTSNDNTEEEGFARTNMAHDWLMRLESQLRHFIDIIMINVFGKDWTKHRLPNGLYDKWKEKMSRDVQRGGRERALIAFADFTDYVLIISRSDNWKVFKPYFGRIEDVRESFQRLYPIRIDTMHARHITQDDALLLYVETKRLIQAIQKKLK